MKSLVMRLALAEVAYGFAVSGSRGDELYLRLTAKEREARRLAEREARQRHQERVAKLARPHQGNRERERRLRRIAKGTLKVTA